ASSIGIKTWAPMGRHILLTSLFPGNQTLLRHQENSPKQGKAHFNLPDIYIYIYIYIYIKCYIL
ncbi:hypothetical protein L9F63_022289, partial [Diploptera punctata]